MQVRFTQLDLDGFAADEDSQGNFEIQRARLSFGGHFYKPTVKYYIQYDLRGEAQLTDAGLVINDDGDGILEPGEISVSRTQKQEPDLRDAYLDFTKYQMSQLRVGQFKVPFSTAVLTSSGSLQFVDRTLALVGFTPGRDQGLMVSGKTNEKKFGYMAGVFNGNGRNQPSNNNEEYLYAVRVNFDPNGPYKLSEGAIDDPQKVNWTIGGAWTQSANDPAGVEDVTILNFFFGLKHHMFSMIGEYFDKTSDFITGEIDSDSFYLQTGLFVVPEKFEVAVRYAQRDPNTAVDDDEVEEARAAVGWFWMKHRYKLQLDYGVITFNKNNLLLLDEIAEGVRPGLSAGDQADDKVFRAQLQLKF